MAANQSSKRTAAPPPNSSVRPHGILMFKIIGIFLVIYVCYAVATGRVWAKAGISGREVLREDSPRYFWVVVVIYAGLSVALFTVF